VKSLWICLLVGLVPLCRAAGEEGKKPIRVYTNEDLDRVSPYRAQTGVLNEPADATPRASGAEATDEAYWRREATRVRDRVAALRERADDIRRSMREADEAFRSEPWTSRGRRRAAPKTAPREAQLAAIEKKIFDLETDLADRARTARALPGWLR
jgi:hypothetical protein